MREDLKRYYTKEEEFLDEFRMAAYAAADLMGDDWHPTSSCNDSLRKQWPYFLSTGKLSRLVFDGAAVHHDESGFSSASVFLKSSKRMVSVQVRQVDGKWVAEIVLDKPVVND